MENNKMGEATNLFASCGGVLTIDLDALIANYQTLAHLALPAQTAAVIKANAYGLGIEHVGPAFYRAGCRVFFVAQLVEAFTLQNALPDDAAIAILNGVQKEGEMLAAETGFWPVLNSLDAIKSWGQLCQNHGKKYPALIQIDSGMARLGLDDTELEALIKTPDIFKQADIRYIISHLANGDERTNPSNVLQLKRLRTALSRLPATQVAFANSGGLYLGADFTYDLTRPGIALYGVDPHGDTPSLIKPVIRLDARVIQTRHVEAGCAVGYGGTFITKRPSLITTIAVGYADGWHRALSNKGAAYYQGQRLPIIGRVSMDSITLDATDVTTAPNRGDLIELIGSHQSLEQVAKDAGTIAYEILTSLGARYQRRYMTKRGL